MYKWAWHTGISYDRSHPPWNTLNLLNNECEKKIMQQPHTQHWVTRVEMFYYFLSRGQEWGSGMVREFWACVVAIPQMHRNVLSAWFGFKNKPFMSKAKANFLMWAECQNLHSSINANHRHVVCVSVFCENERNFNKTFNFPAFSGQSTLRLLSAICYISLFFSSVAVFSPNRITEIFRLKLLKYFCNISSMWLEYQ